MMDYFTSIFHEEAIPLNEFKGDAEAYYARRITDEKGSGSHYHSDADKKMANNAINVYRDKGYRNTNIINTVAKYNKARKDAHTDKRSHEHLNDAVERIREIDKNNPERAKKRGIQYNIEKNIEGKNAVANKKHGVKESFLDFDII